MQMFFIYGKYKGQKQFKAMDLSKSQQTGNLIYASMLTPDEKETFMQKEAPLNPDWQFEARPVKQ